MNHAVAISTWVNSLSRVGVYANLIVSHALLNNDKGTKENVQLRDTDKGHGASTGLTGVRAEAPRMYAKQSQRELAPTNQSTMANGPGCPCLLGGPRGTV
jgi:hypothetical protein